MGFFSLIIFAIVAFVAWYFIAKYKSENGSININENELVKKFNKTVRKLTERNIEDVKSDLYKILDKYKFVKCEQFIENRTQIQSARKQVMEQMRETSNSRTNVKNQIVKLKSETNKDNSNLGAQLVYQYDMLGEIYEKLKVTSEALERKECEFDRELDLFNSKFALKKAEVSMMIANAVTLKNISTIDIRLEDLVSEFQQKVEEQENTDYVRGKLYGTAETTHSEFDIEAYKQKFETFE